MAATIRLGIDMGGTFTDITLLDEATGKLTVAKVPSIHGDPASALVNAVMRALEQAQAAPADVGLLVHGTTLVTNAILERKLPPTALVTTAGFRDVLELARFRSPRPYDIEFRKPEPLAPRRLRFEVTERIAADGGVVLPLDRGALEGIAQALEREKVSALAICFINSCANSVHEAQAAEFFNTRLPAVSVTASTSLLPQLGEYERSSTAVINAYIRPVVKTYVDALERRLKALSIDAPLMIMQSSGGISPAAMVSDMPITIIESGPAAGVLGGQRLATHTGIRDMIVFDMGGTTAKATIIEDFAFGVSREAEVGGGAVLGQRMIKGAGYPVQVPTMDIAEVGAGGGSIAVVDEAGGIRVGPHSAGADPGPVCYDRGGVQPTVTDANLLLGYLNSQALVGGDLLLNFDKARNAVQQIGAMLKLDQTATAYGIHLIANASMLRALRAISSERGRDPAKFILLAIGGNGPVHATSLAEAGGLTHVVVPPVAGLFSALGMLFADVEHQLVKSFYRELRKTPLAEFNAATTELVTAGRAQLAKQGFTTAARQRVVISVDMKYLGQTSPLAVQLAGFPATGQTFGDLPRAFEAEHMKIFGYVPSGDVMQFVALKAICSGVPETPRMPDRVQRGNEQAVVAGKRNAYYGEEHGWVETPVVSRAQISIEPMPGPLIVEEYDTTVIVRPGWMARIDAWNNIHMELAR